jgi:hypothetical protein
MDAYHVTKSDVLEARRRAQTNVGQFAQWKRGWNQWPSTTAFVLLFAKLTCAWIAFSAITTVLGIVAIVLLGVITGSGLGIFGYILRFFGL